ncbi:MAG: ribonuclease P protein component [Cytophagaceae bacterium]|nr:ribonuclease P protein component [Cytophagaceae bacterium]
MVLLEKHKGRGSNQHPKQERLTSKKVIEELFEKGSSSYLYPFRILYKGEILAESQTFPQVLFSVPKRNFKKAVDRNRIRRQMREAYRINKQRVFSGQKLKIPEFLAILYTSKEKIPFKQLEEKLILILERCKNT